MSRSKMQRETSRKQTQEERLADRVARNRMKSQRRVDRKLGLFPADAVSETAVLTPEPVEADKSIESVKQTEPTESTDSEQQSVLLEPDTNHPIAVQQENPPVLKRPKYSKPRRPSENIWLFVNFIQRIADLGAHYAGFGLERFIHMCNCLTETEYDILLCQIERAINNLKAVQRIVKQAKPKETKSQSNAEEE